MKDNNQITHLTSIERYSSRTYLSGFSWSYNTLITEDKIFMRPSYRCIQTVCNVNVALEIGS